MTKSDTSGKTIDYSFHLALCHFERSPQGVVEKSMERPSFPAPTGNLFPVSLPSAGTHLRIKRAGTQSGCRRVRDFPCFAHFPYRVVTQNAPQGRFAANASLFAPRHAVTLNGGAKKPLFAPRMTFSPDVGAEMPVFAPRMAFSPDVGAKTPLFAPRPGHLSFRAKPGGRSREI